MEITLHRGRIAGPVAVLVLATLFCLGAAYLGGLITVLGYETQHKTFNGFASGTRSGGGFGLKHMFFLEGQTFYARYEAEVREGSLRIGILNLFEPGKPTPHHVESITANGSGEVTYRIPVTGLYSIYFDGSVLGPRHTGRYDVSYTMVWGAR